MPKKNILIVIVVAVIAALCGAIVIGSLIFTGDSQGSIGGIDAAAASSTVAAFGLTLQNVSLLAPDASTTIASTYASYVDASLLTEWEGDPSEAPGRTTSSPWPDHIAIDSVAPQGTGFVVTGRIIEMTSNEVEHGGDAGEVPVVIQLVPQDGKLVIVAYQQQSHS